MPRPYTSPSPWIFNVDQYAEGDSVYGIQDADGNDVMEYAGCGSHSIDIPNPLDRRAILAAGEMYQILEWLYAHPEIKPEMLKKIGDVVRKIEGP